MSDVVQALVQYGYVLLFVFVLVDQIGLRCPPCRCSSASARCARAVA